VVRYRILSSTTTEWRTLRVGGLSAEVTSLTLHQLRPETSYEFAVLARNRLGDGLFSEITTARTRGRFNALQHCSRASEMTIYGEMADWRDTWSTCQR